MNAHVNATVTYPLTPIATSTATPATPTCVRLIHRSQYRYDRPVQLGPQLIRLRPAPHARAEIQSYELQLEPSDSDVHWQQDLYANNQARVLVHDRTDRFDVTVNLQASLSIVNPFDFFVEPYAEQMPVIYGARDQQGLAPYMPLDSSVDYHAGRFQELFASIRSAQMPTIAFLVEVNRRVHTEIRYLVRHEPGIQTPEQTLRLGSGSCRDLAWLTLQLLRRFGFAARFVSGYWIQVHSTHAPELHAWVEVYVPGAGWLGVDPTAGLFAGAGHIPLACSPEPSGAAPIEGSVEACGVQFNHDIQATIVSDTAFVNTTQSLSPGGS